MKPGRPPHDLEREREDILRAIRMARKAFEETLFVLHKRLLRIDAAKRSGHAEVAK